MPRSADPQRRALILRVARQQFARDGFVGTTMADIALAAGMGVGSLYVYFPTKDAIALSLLQTYLDEVEHAIVPPMVKLQGAKAIATSISAGFQLVEPNADLIHLLRQVPHEMVVLVCQRLPQVLEPAVAGQITRGQFRPLDPHFVTQWINEQITWAINMCVLEKQYSLASCQRQLVDLISRALLPQPAGERQSELGEEGGESDRSAIP